MKKIYIETYGCSSNQMDSQIMRSLLSKEYQLVGAADASDLIIINTCTVKQATENKERHRINHLQKMKKKLVIAGCMPEAARQKVEDIAPHASLISTNHVMDIASVVENTLDNQKTVLLGKDKKPKTLLPKQDVNPAVRILEIQSGCDYFCNFCATKLAKGANYSYPNRDIIKEISLAVKRGIKEFWITGQEIAGYNDGVNLPQLIEKITARVEGNYFLRLGMMHPNSLMPIVDELIEVYKDERVFKFLHLPIQSGSNKILHEMQRKSGVEEFCEIIKRFRKAIPRITVWTDVIVGFPTEDEEDFQSTCDLLNEIKPDYTNVSQYGIRNNTKASKMRQLPTKVKKERTKIISELVNKIHLEQNRKWVGWHGKAIVDEFNPSRDNFVARNISYKPIALQSGSALGDIVDVKIVDARATCLFGVPIK